MKALCIKPCFYGGNKVNVDDEKELSEIPLTHKECFTIGGELLENMDLADKLFSKGGPVRTVKESDTEITKLNNKLADEQKKKSSVEVELAELKAKIEAGDYVPVEDTVPAPKEASKVTHSILEQATVTTEDDDTF